MTTADDVYTALKKVNDPEIGISLVDLGLIYGVEVEDGRVSVTMTLTTPRCPMHSAMRSWVEKAVRDIPGVREANVRVVWDPPWTPERLSPEAKRQLGLL